MPGLWETAEMLIAIAGDGDAAAAAAHAMAADCRRSRRPRDAAFWVDVAMAARFLANPQPMIAPSAPPAAGADLHRLHTAPRTGGKAAASATVHRLEFAERLPRRRKRVQSIKRKLKAILERHARPADKPERED